MTGRREQLLGLHLLLPARPIIVPWLATATLVAGAAASKDGKVPDAESLRRQENLLTEIRLFFFFCASMQPNLA